MLGGGYDSFVSKIQVFAASTTTVIASSMNPSVSGKPVTFRAVVSSVAGLPLGKIKYLHGTTLLAELTLIDGSANYTTSTLPPGANIITAVYEGDSNFSASTSAALNQFVLAATTTALSSSPNPSTYGQAVTFTAAVSSKLGQPPDGETVSFIKGTVLGTGALSAGSTSLRTSTLPVGTSAIKAVYVGDSNFAGSSATLSEVINTATTATTLISSLNPSKVGQTVTFRASVRPRFSGKVTGNVTFYNGATALKTVPLSVGIATFTTSTLIHGAHSVKAIYHGSTNFKGSSASLTQTVN